MFFYKLPICCLLFWRLLVHTPEVVGLVGICGVIDVFVGVTTENLVHDVLLYGLESIMSDMCDFLLLLIIPNIL